MLKPHFATFHTDGVPGGHRPPDVSPGILEVGILRNTRFAFRAPFQWARQKGIVSIAIQAHKRSMTLWLIPIDDVFGVAQNIG